MISLRKTEPLVAAKPTGEYVLHRRAQPVPSDRVVLPRPRKTPPPPTVGASRMPDGQVRITANGTTLVVSASEARLLADLLAGLVF